MKKLLFLIMLMMGTATVKAQFPTTDSLERFINRYIRNSAVEAFQNLRLNTALIGMTKFIDSAYGGQIVSMDAPNDSTVRIITLGGDTLTAIVSGQGTVIANASTTGDTLWNGSALKRLDTDATITRSTNATKILLGVDTISYVSTPSKLRDTSLLLRSIALLKDNSYIWPNHLSYNTYQQTIGPSTNNKPIEILNIGYTGHGATDSIHLNSTGLVRINGRLDMVRNLQWDSVNAKWLTPYKHATAYGSSMLELGGEAVILHSTPAGVDFNDVPHEILMASANGPDGVTGYPTGYVVQSKAPVYMRYSSAAYNPLTTNNSWNPSTNTLPLFHLHSEEQKGTENEFAKFEMNHSSTGGFLYFKRSNGTFASKTAAGTGVITGGLRWGLWDGSAYQNTAAIDAVSRGTISSGTARQSLRFLVGTTNTASLATGAEIDSAFNVYNRPIRINYSGSMTTIPIIDGPVPRTISSTAVSLQPASTVNGGAMLQGFTIPGQDTAYALHLRGMQSATAPTRPNMLFQATKFDGVDSLTDLAATEQAFQFRNNGTNLIMVMGNGNTFIGTAGGTNVYPRKLYVNGSIGAHKDSIQIVGSVTSERVLLQDSITGQFKRIAASALGGGSTDSSTFSTNYRRDTASSNLRAEIAAKVSDEAYDESTWNGVTGIAPSKNAIRDQLESMIAAEFDLYNSDGRGSPWLYGVSSSEAYLRTLLIRGSGITVDTTASTDSTLVVDLTVSGGSVSGTGTSGRVAFWNGSSSLSSDANFLFGASTGLSVGTTNTQGRLNLGGNKSLTSSGAQSYFAPATYNDAITGASGTANSYSINVIGSPTITATNAGVTFPEIATLSVDPPLAGTNATITSPWAIQTTANGHVNVGGDLVVGTLDTDATPPTPSGAMAVVMVDANGKMSFLKPQSVTTTATLTPTSGNNIVVITALAGNVTIDAPTGTFLDGQAFRIWIKDNGVSRTITWNATYTAMDFALPTATVAGKWMELQVERMDGKFFVNGKSQEP